MNCVSFSIQFEALKYAYSYKIITLIKIIHIFTTLKCVPMSFCDCSFMPHLLAPRQSLLYMLPCIFERDIHMFFGLASFTEHNYFEIPPCCCI